MAYQVKLESFEGPLDLLLYLISKAKVDIVDISISDITAQYLDYLYQMQTFNIDIASEFLVMAATLLHIKSCKLVPRRIPESEEDTIDPQKQLIEKLIEYKRYKEASMKLSERYLVYSNVYCKMPEETLDYKEDALQFSNISKDDLKLAIIKLLNKEKKVRKSPIVHHIKRESITLSERIKQLKAFLYKRSNVKFSELIGEGFTPSRIVITFTALLEMVNKGWVVLEQSKPFTDIRVKRRWLKWINNK